MFISSEELLTRGGEGKQKSLIKLFPTVQWFGVVIVGGIFIGAFFSQTGSQWLLGGEQIIHQNRWNSG